MTRKSLVALLVCVALSASFNVLFFTVLSPLSHGANTWVVYGAVHVALVVVATCVVVATFKKELRAMRISLVAISVAYFAATLLTALFFLTTKIAPPVPTPDDASQAIQIAQLFPLPLVIAIFAFFPFCFALFCMLDFVVSFSVVE